MSTIRAFGEQLGSLETNQVTGAAIAAAIAAENVAATLAATAATAMTLAEAVVEALAATSTTINRATKELHLFQKDEIRENKNNKNQNYMVLRLCG